MRAIVTVRLSRDPKHEPQHKQTGLCPLSKIVKGVTQCTDVRGEQHSYIEEGKDFDDIKNKARAKFPHVTRIETILITVG
jgi:hypothetical protein